MNKITIGLLITLAVGGTFYGLKQHADNVVSDKVAVAKKEFIKETQESIKQKEKNDKLAKEKAEEKEVDSLGIPIINGNPKMTVASEYNKSWNVYENHYKDFTLAFTDNSGGYAAGYGRKLFGATIGKTTFNDLKKKFGKPVTEIQKGNVIYELSSNQGQEQLVYNIEGYYVTFFIDKHNNNRLRSIQYIKKNVEMQKDGYYGKASAQLREGYERLMVELINESRVEAGLNPLTYDDGLTTEARNHSQDMVDNHYFSHTGSDGSQPKTRMEAVGYDEQLYAENIAYGQYSSIYAHEALMNSLGHRENILNPELTHVGVGVAFDSKNIPYYTINFYTPFN